MLGWIGDPGTLSGEVVRAGAEFVEYQVERNP